MKNKEIYITNKKINNKRIALFSDLHYCNSFNLRIFNKILRQIKEICPDYILIVGDIVDNTDVNYDLLYQFLCDLEKYGKVFIALGNHDIYKYYNSMGHKTLKEVFKGNWILSDFERFKDVIDKLSNTYLLNNETYFDKDSNIAITGINLSYEYYRNKEKIEVFKKEISALNISTNSKYYNILLIHSPYNVYKCPEILKDYDLVLSGHMHAGLVHPVFGWAFTKNRGFFSPRIEFFANYVRGRTKTQYFEGYIYEGITKLSESSTKLLHLFDILFPKKVRCIEINKIDT